MFNSETLKEQFLISRGWGGEGHLRGTGYWCHNSILDAYGEPITYRTNDAIEKEFDSDPSLKTRLTNEVVAAMSVLFDLDINA